MVKFTDIIRKSKPLTIDIKNTDTGKKERVNFYIHFSPIGQYTVYGVSKGVIISLFMFKIMRDYDLLERRIEVAKQFRRQGLSTAVIDYLDELALKYRKQLIKEGTIPKNYRDIGVVPDEHAYMSPNGIDFWYNRLKRKKREFLISEKYINLTDKERKGYENELAIYDIKFLYNKTTTGKMIELCIPQKSNDKEIRKIK